jgi:molybdopterin-guanine dinucleotide biosynthesis protein A
LNSSNKVTGIILSGGKSARMGKNKAFIEIGGIPIIQRIHSLFKKLFEEIIIVTNERDLFADLDAKIFSDLIPNRGALGGLYTGLFYSSFHYSFCVACDMPFLRASLIEYLLTKIDHYDLVVPRTQDGLQPLHAIYSKNCLAPVKMLIDQGKYRIIELYDMVCLRIIDEIEFRSLDPDRESFINVNTPGELDLLEKSPFSSK